MHSSANAQVICSELDIAAPGILKERTQQYHDKLSQKAKELCDSNLTTKANSLYQNGASQLGSFLANNSIQLSDACKTQVDEDVTLPLRRIPNLVGIFNLSEGFDICKPNTKVSKDSSKEGSLPEATKALSSPSIQQQALDYETLKRIKSMNGHLTPELREYSIQLEKAHKTNSGNSQ